MVAFTVLPALVLMYNPVDLLGAGMTRGSSLEGEVG